MHYHIINSSKFGGSELVACKLSKYFSKSILIIIFKKNQLFIKKFKIIPKNFFFLLRKIFIENKNDKFLTHNIQAHIIINILSILKKYISKNNKSICLNVIHFDAFYVKNLWLFFFIKSLKYSKTKLIFVSDYAKCQFLKKIEFDVNHEVIYNSISNKYITKNNKNKLIKINQKQILKLGFIGRYAPVKNLPLFLEICLAINKVNNNFIEINIQSDINKKELYKIIKKISFKNNYCLKKIEIKLYKEDNDPIEFYKNIDVLLSTSKTETFGLTCIEALAMGKRIYTINSNSIESILGNIKFNLKSNNTEAIARLLIDSFAKDYNLPDISKFKEEIMLKKYINI